jgi:hypothetical protein
MMYITVQITYKGLDVIDSRNKKEEHLLEEDKVMSDSKVKYSLGMTINLGNYDSARVDVGVEIPADSENLDEAYVKASEYCNEKILEEVGILSEMKKK